LDGSTDHPTHDCPICRDEGFVIDKVEREVIRRDGSRHTYFDDVAKPCACMERKRIHRLFKSSHITDEFQKLGFQNFVVDGRPACVNQARDMCLHYLRNFELIRGGRQNSVALLGHPGTGKTHLLMAISNNLMRKGVSVLYFPWVEGGNELKDNLDELESRIHAMKTVDVLFIDDLFKGRKEPTAFMLEQLFGVVNYRYLNHLPILLSSEKDIDAICAIDEGIGSRLYQMAKSYTVVMGLTDEERKKGIQLNFRL
jgi:DNA replication protein DnaC